MSGPTRSIPLIVALALLIGLPLALRPAGTVVPPGAAQVIIVTPHNEQIRSEFGPAFDAWHRREHGTPANVVFSVPGGTSEIRKLLQSQFESDLRAGRPVGGHADLVFGGGSYEHEQLKRGISVTADGETLATPISAPVAFSADELDAWYGENMIGRINLYDPAGHWFGLAVSGFGIVYNRDVLAELDVEEPTVWDDLCDPRVRGWVALVNPGQSGSVTTAFEAILQRRGWIDGWRILRRMAANSRYFSGSSLKPPNDVSRGDAAMGVCIDFYGRFQSQAIEAAGGGPRLGYVDPAGQTMIDPDPISMLQNAPNRETAERFIRFCLSDEGQALWQFHAGAEASGDAPAGPHRFELRRMPIRRAMYERFLDRFVDQVDPYEIARPLDDYRREFRAFIAVLFAAMAIDNHHALRDAWTAIVTHPAYPDTNAIVTAADVDDPQLAGMLRRFDAWPDVDGPDGPLSLGDVPRLAEIKAGWLRGGWSDRGLWPVHERPQDAMRRLSVRYFAENYEQICDAGTR